MPEKYIEERLSYLEGIIERLKPEVMKLKLASIKCEACGGDTTSEELTLSSGEGINIKCNKCTWSRWISVSVMFKEK